MQVKNIIIIGFNTIAENIAKMLCDEENVNLYVIDSSHDLSQKQDVMDAVFIKGTEYDPEILKQANIETAHILINLSEDDSVNIAVSILAKHFNPDIRIISSFNTLSSYSYERLKNNFLNVDMFISPEELSATKIEYLLKHPSIIEYNPLLAGKFTILAFEVEKDMNIIDKSLITVAKMIPNISALVITIQRDGKTIVPNGKTIIRENDIIYTIVQQKNIKEFFEAFNIKTKKINSILILGAGKYSRALVKKIHNQNYDITIIDKDKYAIEEMKAEYPEFKYLVKDIKDADLREKKELFETDVYIAMTDTDQVNLISSVYAKQNTKSTIYSLAFEKEYFNKFNKFKIKHVINPKSLLSNKLLLYLNEDNILSIINLFNEEIKMIEIIPSEKSKLIGKTLSQLKNLPKGTIIGLINHNNHSFIPTGVSVINKNDRLFLFVKNKYVQKALKLFR